MVSLRKHHYFSKDLQSTIPDVMAYNLHFEWFLTCSTLPRSPDEKKPENWVVEPEGVKGVS